MKRQILLILGILIVGLSILVVLTVVPKIVCAQSPVYSISGYIDTPGAQTKAAEVYLYTVSTGGTPIKETCMGPNRYYEFTDVDDGTYYLDICAKPGFGGACPRYKMDSRPMVVVSGSDEEQDLYADDCTSCGYHPCSEY